MERMTSSRCPECFPKGRCHHIIVPFLKYLAFGSLSDGLKVGKDCVEVHIKAGANTNTWRPIISVSSVRRRKIGHPPEKTEIVERLDEPGCAVVFKMGELLGDRDRKSRGERVDEWCLIVYGFGVGVCNWLFLVHFAIWRRVDHLVWIAGTETLC